MKKSNFFWGFFLLTLGTLILLNKYDALNVDWNFIWELYPLILVFWGLMLVVSGKVLKALVAILFGIIFSVLAYGTFMNIVDDNPFNAHFEDESFEQDFFYESFDNSIKSAHLNFEGGAGKIFINGTTNELVEANYTGSKNIYDIYKKVENGKAYVEIDSKIKKIKLLNDDFQNDLELSLSASPIWNLDFKLGAAKADFDLSGNRVEKLSISAGVSSITLKVGDKQNILRIETESGMTKFKILVPRDSGVKLIRSGVLNSKSLNDFVKRNDGMYYSGNYDYSDNKIFIKLNGMFTQLRIEKY